MRANQILLPTANTYKSPPQTTPQIILRPRRRKKQEKHNASLEIEKYFLGARQGSNKYVIRRSSHSRPAGLSRAPLYTPASHTLL